MDVNNILKNFMKSEEKNLYITDIDGNPVYKSRITDIPPEIVMEKIKSIPSDFDEQDFTDKTHDLYFNLKKTIVESEGKKYICYQTFDISEYAKLIRDIVSYMKVISAVSKFQTYIMENISTSYDAFLPGLAEYYSTDCIMMFIEKNKNVIKSTYKSGQSISESSDRREYEKYFSLKRGDSTEEFFCILNSVIQGCKCAVLVKNTDSSSPFTNNTVHNIISLFIEKSLLIEKTIYESEHDSLTGLYNKRKYLQLRDEGFGNPRSIAVYNFDVNNLKSINDNFGHTLGDELIVNAARSISAVCSENVLGFRMGGDEYIMTALDLTEEEAEGLKEKWRLSLEKINNESDDIFVSMSCGMVYGSGDYDFDELFSKADKLMYYEKKKLKNQGNTSFVLSEKESE